MAEPRKPREKRVVETEDFAAFVARTIDALVERAVIDPAALIHFGPLIERLKDGMNWGIARAKDGQDVYTLSEIAAILGISGPAVQKRVNRGRELIAMAEDSANVIRLRDSLGAPSVPALRRERAEALEAAGVEDRRQGKHRKSA